MIQELLKTFESSLNLITLIGLILDAVGAILVLGPDVPTVSRVATKVERRHMNNLLEELARKGKLHENVEPFDRLFKEMQGPKPIPFDVEEMTMEENRVVFGSRGLENGDRTSKTMEDFQEWIDKYRGIDREYYLAGGGLLLMGFLFQIVAQSASISVLLGAFTLLVTLFVGGYLLYRAREYVWWVPSI